MLTIIHWILILAGLGYIAHALWRTTVKAWRKLGWIWKNWQSNNDPSRVIRVKYKHWWWHLQPEKRFAARQIEQALQYRTQQPEVVAEFRNHIKRILVYGKSRTIDGAFEDRRPLTEEERAKIGKTRETFVDAMSDSLRDTFATPWRKVFPDAKDDDDAIDEPDIPAGWAFIANEKDGWDIRRPDQLARMDCLPEATADSLEEACQWVEKYLELYPPAPEFPIMVSTPAGGKDNPWRDMLDEARHTRAQLQADKLDNLYPVGDPDYLENRKITNAAMGWEDTPVIPLTGCVEPHTVMKTVEAQSDGNN